MYSFFFNVAIPQLLCAATGCLYDVTQKTSLCIPSHVACDVFSPELLLYFSPILLNRIGGVMVIVIDSSAVNSSPVGSNQRL